MNKQTISTEEGNKIIHLFLEKDGHIMPELMKYHSSWDWARPAYEKFRNIELKPLGGVNDSRRCFLLHALRMELAYGTIDSFFNRLVRAIQWYNSIKQSKTE